MAGYEQTCLPEMIKGQNWLNKFGFGSQKCPRMFRPFKNAFSKLIVSVNNDNNANVNVNVNSFVR